MKQKITGRKLFEVTDSGTVYAIKGRACIDKEKYDGTLNEYVDSLLIDNYYINQKKVKENQMPGWIIAKLNDLMFRLSSWEEKS